MVGSWGVWITKYGKVTEIKWLIISKSVMIFIFVECIDQLIDCPINCASLAFPIYQKDPKEIKKYQ